MIRYLLILLLTISLFGCMDIVDTSSGENDDTQDPSGIWLGSQTSVGVGAFDMRTIIYSGRIFGISEDAGVMFAGTYMMNSGKYLVSDGTDNSSTSYRLYDLYDNNNAFAIGMVSAAVQERAGFKGSYVNSANQEGEVSALYSSLYEKAVSIENIQGVWSTARQNIDIDEDGIITGTLDYCEIEGDVSIPHKDRNIFEIGFTLSECDNEGIYDGLGIILQDESGNSYFLALTSNSERMENFGFQLNNTPESFVDTTLARTAAVNTSAREAAEPTGRDIELELITGENHDGEDFTGQNLGYLIENSSYRNALFDGTSFMKSENYNSYCNYTPYVIMDRADNQCNYTRYLGAKITNSDFSGSTFIENKFVASDARVEIDGSDFSGTSFTDYPWKPSNNNFIATDTDFTGSTFNQYRINFDAESNDLTDITFNDSIVRLTKGNVEGITVKGSNLTSEEGDLTDVKLIDDSTITLANGNIFGAEIIKNSTLTLTKGSLKGPALIENIVLTITDGNIEGVTLKESSLKIGTDNPVIKDVTFDNSDLVIDKVMDMQNVTFTQGSGLVIDVDIDTLSGMLNLDDFISQNPDMIELKVKIDMPDKDLSGTHIIFNATEPENRPLLLIFDHYLGVYKNGNFSGTNFTDATFSLNRYLLDSIPESSNQYYNYTDAFITKTDFTKANFTNAAFTQGVKQPNDNLYSYKSDKPSFEECNFNAANFHNADLTGATFADSDFVYTNFEGAKAPSTFVFSNLSNAWWTDGSRCAPGSIEFCIPVPDVLNTGLTYEEYLDGKDDTDKLAENIKNEVKELVDDGVGFVKDTGSQASNTVKKFFGW
ncbi:MAG: hypothetical protein C0602_07555 [Denitrovibrio sp.]|nr:MAG: hypothetical protein C0602_07555 [Denitrovibrio sp.]